MSSLFEIRSRTHDERRCVARHWLVCTQCLVASWITLPQRQAVATTGEAGSLMKCQACTRHSWRLIFPLITLPLPPPFGHEVQQRVHSAMARRSGRTRVAEGSTKTDDGSVAEHTQCRRGAESSVIFVPAYAGAQPNQIGPSLLTMDICAHR